MKSKIDPFTKLVAEEDQPHKVPDSWLWVEIGALCEVIGGGTPSTTKESHFDGGTIPWVTPADMSGYSEMYISAGKRNLTESGLQNSSARLLPKDSLLFSSRAPIGYVAIAKNPITTNQGFKSFPPTEAYIPHYGYWYLRSIKTLAESMASGTTFLELSGSKAATLPFPLPPLAEQRRIVAKLDAAMQRAEASQARLEKIPGLLKQFRQAVLAAAVSGQLTEAWRAKQLELRAAADALEGLQLSRISQARNPKAKSRLAEIFNIVEQGNHFELPDTWQFVALDKLATAFNYGTSAKSENTGEVPVLRMGNLQGGKIDWSDLKYTSSKEEIEQYTLTAGDVLFNRTNSPELVGKTSIYRGEQPAIFAGYLIRIKTAPELNPEYLNYCLNSSYARQYCWDVKTDGVSQSNINAQKLSRFEVPFCSLEEQLEIVRQVNHYFELADQLEARFEQAAVTVEELPQALLAKAFSGQLVPQDPNDVPASVLLERIKFATDNLPAKATRKARTIATDATGTKQTRSNMKAKPVKTLPEFVERLTQLGGKAEPKQLLIEFDLQNDVDSFFELLRDGKSQGLLNVPMGKDGLVELV